MAKDLSYYQNKKSLSEKLIVGGALGAVVSFLGMQFTAVNLPGLYNGFILLIVVSIILAAIGGFQFSSIVKKFKNEYLKDIISEWIEDGYYDPKRGLSPAQVYHCEFLKKADRFHSEDLLTGTIDGIRFQASDIQLQERHVRHTKNGTQTYYVTYFKGQMYVFDFNKDFDGYLQVLENQRPQSRRKYERVKLESIDFNKKFNTYTTNQHTAFYILTPPFMERLMAIEKAHPGKIGFAFIDNQLHLGINNNKSNFTIHLFRRIDEALMKAFQDDLKVIYSIIDELKINKKIFKEV
jgi:hypothetical protein